MDSVKALVFHQAGPAVEVLQLETAPLPDPAAGEVRVGVLAAPINPADINTLEGSYGKLPELPAVPGSEGLAEVVACGDGVAGLEPGDRVLLPGGVGTWREALNVRAEVLVRVPREIDPLQGAMLRVNPPTAWRRLHDFVPLKEGDWVLQNAGNSGVGRAVIQIAKARGWRTASAVRRMELAPELEALGADLVIPDERDAYASLRERTGGSKIRLGLNAVGGESATALAGALAPGGTMVTYGAMSKKALKIPNAFMIFRDLQLRGFWLTRWFERAPRPAVDAMFGELLSMLSAGRLSSRVAAAYPLDQHAEAIAHALREGRDGKVLFRMRP